jgi:F0F1-type ATP synthase delta subunit
MKYSSDIYAEALTESVAGKSATEASNFIGRFIRIVAKNGDLGHASSILETFSRKMTKKNGNKYVTLEYARPAREDKKNALASQFGKDDVMVEKINPELIAGVRITIDGEREIDLSLSGKLKKLMR